LKVTSNPLGLKQVQLARPRHRFLASGDPDEFRRLGARFLGPEVGAVERRGMAVPVQAEAS